MKIRGVILATCALMVFWACYAMANEPEPQTPSSAAPVMVPYLNKSISQIREQQHDNSRQNSVSDGTESYHGDADPAESGGITETYAGGVLRCTGTMPELLEPDGGVQSDPVLNDWVYYGNCRITHYDTGACCCGVYATGYTASGTLATVGRTVATGEDLPFGTKVLINGQVYIVEDRGVDPYCIDVLVSDHDTALAMGMYYADVYISR